MKILTDWKTNLKGWPVNLTKDDTDGLGMTEYVIYTGTHVSKSKTAGGAQSFWGKITGVSPSSVAGETASLFFRITCPSGELKGELSDKPLPVLWGNGDEDYDPVGGTPGSWTAAEGSGQGLCGGEHEEEDVELVDSKRAREA